MKKHATSKIAPLFIFLASFAAVALHGFAAASPAKAPQAADRQLQRMFREMGIFNVSGGTDPIEITLNDLNGNPVSLSDFRGKIVFLNFWTTWCPACRVEMASMEKLHQKLRNRNFAVVTINLQESASQVKKFFQDHKLTFTALLDTTGQVGTWLGIRSIPATLIIDARGRIIGRALGPRTWDGSRAIAMFEHLIDHYSAAKVSNSDQ